MIDETEIRCFIHPYMKQEFEEWKLLLNNTIEQRTGYPIPTTIPFTSKFCAVVLKKIRESLTKDSFKFNHNGVRKFAVEISLGDEESVNLELYKQKGVKKNVISSLE